MWKLCVSLMLLSLALKALGQGFGRDGLCNDADPITGIPNQPDSDGCRYFLQCVGDNPMIMPCPGDSAYSNFERECAINLRDNDNPPQCSESPLSLLPSDCADLSADAPDCQTFIRCTNNTQNLQTCGELTVYSEMLRVCVHVNEAITGCPP